MSPPRLAVAVAVAVAFVVPAVSHAQPIPAPPPQTPAPASAIPAPAPPALAPAPPTGAPARDSRWPLAATRRPLTLWRGLCEMSLVGEANLTKRESFRPVSFAPDALCGISDRLTLGLVTSAPALSLIDSGEGLCLGGVAGDPVHDCQRPVDNAAVEALYLVRDGDAAVAARARLVVSSFGPVKPAIRLGARLRLRHGRTALVLDPELGIGLANRDRGNRDTVALPITGQIQLGRRVLIEILSGVRGELAVFGDAYQIPVGLAAQVSPTPAWDLGLELGFPELLGPRNTFKERHLSLWLTWRPQVW